MLQDKATTAITRDAAPAHIRAVKWFLLTAALMTAIATSGGYLSNPKVFAPVSTPVTTCGKGFSEETNPDHVWETVGPNLPVSNMSSTEMDLDSRFLLVTLMDLIGLSATKIGTARAWR